VSYVDPTGLWSVSISVFLGWGGGITLGQNPSGRFFGSIRAGYGIGGGLAWDPKGKSPDGGACSGVSTGQYTEASFHFGPLEVLLGANSGFSQAEGLYFTPIGASANVVPSIGAGASASGGVELTFQ
jgi:hypothetical protein